MDTLAPPLNAPLGRTVAIAGLGLDDSAELVQSLAAPIRLLGGDVLDDTTPWELQLTKTPGNFNTLTADEVSECYMLVEYALGAAK